MSYLEQEIIQVTRTVWETVLGLELDRLETHPVVRGGERTIAGSVRFSGAWNGALALQCPRSLARRAAATMFGVSLTEPAQSEMQDAVGELANMTGGNLKSVLPEPCRLSLPSVVEAIDSVPLIAGMELITEIAFDCGGELVLVRLLREETKVEGPHKEIREFTRVHAEVGVEVIVGAQVICTGHLVNLSLNGMLLLPVRGVEIGSPCQVTLVLGSDGPAIRANGRVVRAGDDGLGVSFEELVGVESLEHLRNLIRYNGTDVRRIDGEFECHLGLRSEP